MRNLVCSLALALLPFAGALAASPYAGEQSRQIKSLSSSEIEDLLAGRGMGLARAAELNGYPGPMHVLELASELKLTSDQEAKTRTLFSQVRKDAAAAGARLIEAERALDTLFAARTADSTRLREALEQVASLQAAVRGIHLQAHIDQAAVLNADQIARYSALRGYGAGGQTHQHRPGGGHRH